MARASRLRASRYGAQAALLAVIAAAACPHAAVENNTLTAINGITVGHYTLAERPTGCTVILFDGHTVAGISQRGSAPGTRDTDLLQPTNAPDRVDAVVLSGGSADREMRTGRRVAAIAAVNALGDVIDPGTGAVVAGARNDDGSLADVRRLLRSGAALQRTSVGENTTIAVVATNARLTKSDVSRVASMADDGIARAIVPAHTTADGDTVFAVATGAWSGD